MSKRPERLWGLLSPPLNGYWGSLPDVQRPELHVNRPPLHSVEVRFVWK